MYKMLPLLDTPLPVFIIFTIMEPNYDQFTLLTVCLSSALAGTPQWSYVILEIKAEFQSLFLTF